MDQTGLPTLSKNVGVFANGEVQNRMKKIATPEVSYGAIVAAALAAMETEAFIVIDPTAREVWVANDADVIAQVPSNGPSQTFAPEAGQEGRVLTWEETAVSDPAPYYRTGAKAAVDPSKPARKVSSLVAGIINAIPQAILDAGTHPFIMVNQVTGQVIVQFVQTRATAEAALDAATPAGGDACVVTLTEPAEDSVTPPKIFEGGAVA